MSLDYRQVLLDITSTLNQTQKCIALVTSCLPPEQAAKIWPELTEALKRNQKALDGLKE